MKKVIVMLAILFLSPCYFAFANLEINEIMYDLPSGSDTGREWIEIYNNSDVQVDLTTVRLFEADTNHKLTLIQGNDKIPAHGYAVLTSNSIKFKTDRPGFSGAILDSTFSLNNSGESLALKELQKNSEAILDQYTYNASSGGAGDGNSLQKINGAWIGTVATPGVENSLFVKPKIKEVSTPHAKLSTPTPAQKTEAVTLIQPIKNDEAQENPYEISRLRNVTILIVLITIGSGVSYYIRRRNRETNHLETAEDFEILE